MAKSKSKKRTTPIAQVKDATTLLQEARAALRRGGLDRAIAIANSAHLQSSNNQEKQLAQQYLAECYFRQAVEQEGDERIASLGKALRCNPEDGRAYFYRAMAYWHRLDASKAHEDFKQVQRLEPQRPHIHYFVKLASLLVEGKVNISNDDQTQLSEAERHSVTLLQALNKGEDPAQLPEPLLGDAALWQSLLRMYLEPDAQPSDTLQRQLEAKPSTSLRPWLRYLLLLCSLRADDIEATLQQMEALALYKNLPYALQNSLKAVSIELLQRLAQADDWQATLRLMRFPWIAEESNMSSLMYIYDHLAYRAAQNSQWDVACEYWQKVAASAPTRYTMQNLALSYEWLENWHEAAQAWRNMLRRRPRKEDHPDYLSPSQVSALWRHAGDCYLKLISKLMQEFEEAEAFDPWSDKDAMYPEDAQREAINCYRKALQYAEGDYSAEVQQGLVNLLYDNNQITAAENELDRLIDDHPDFVPARLLRGSTSYEHDLSKTNQALADLEYVLRLEPTNEEARDSLAQLCLIHTNVFVKSDEAKATCINHYLPMTGDHPKLLAVSIDMEIQTYKNPAQHKTSLLPKLQRLYEAASNHYHPSRKIYYLQGAISRLVYIEADEEAEALIARLLQTHNNNAIFWLMLAEDCLTLLMQGIARKGLLGFSDNALQRTGDDLRVLAWGRRLCDEAIRCAVAVDDKKHSLAYVLAYAYDIADDRDITVLLEHYFARIEAEVPESGAKEYALICQALRNKEKANIIKRYFKTAKKKAHASDEPALLELIDELENKLAPPRIRNMIDLFG